MTGMDINTGKALSGRAHLLQSVAHIVHTAQGEMLEHRHYGSRAFESIDSASNGANRLRLFASIAQGLKEFEPRLKLQKLTMSSNAEGQATINLSGLHLVDGQPTILQVPA